MWRAPVAQLEHVEDSKVFQRVVEQAVGYQEGLAAWWDYRQSSAS